MNESFKGKRLLVLGSTSHIADIVIKARSMGLYVIVTDYKDYSDAPAKQIANEYWNISLADTETLASRIKTQKINGVLTGFTDSYLKYYLRLCEAANLPCYGSENTFEIASNKEAFKNMCKKFGVRSIPGMSVRSFDDLESAAKKIKFPLLLKPADNSGSRGVIKCNTELDLKSAFNHALSFSPSKTVLCERFMECSSIGASYMLSNGKVILSSVCDRVHYRSAATGSSIVSALVYPSTYLDRYVEEVNPSVINMLSKSGFKNGMLSIQAFVDDDYFYQCEMCFRPSGGKHYVFIKNQTGVDELASLINFSVTGNMSCVNIEKENPKFNDQCLLIHILGKEGQTIASTKGFDELAQEVNVLRVVRYLKEGDVIGKDGTTAQIIASVWCVIPKGKHWEDTVSSVVQSVSVLNKEGKSVLIDTACIDNLLN